MKKILAVAFCILLIAGCDSQNTTNSQGPELPEGSRLVETREFGSHQQCVSYAKERQSKKDVTKVNEGANATDMYAAYMHLENGRSLTQICFRIGGITEFKLIETDHLITEQTFPHLKGTAPVENKVFPSIAECTVYARSKHHDSGVVRVMESEVALDSYMAVMFLANGRNRAHGCSNKDGRTLYSMIEKVPAK